MKGLLEKIDNLVWENFSDENLVINEDNFYLLEEAVRILDLAEQQGNEIAEREISSSKELQQWLLSPEREEIHVLEESDYQSSEHISEEGISLHSESDSESNRKPTFRMNSQHYSTNEFGESSITGGNRNKKRPKPEQGYGSQQNPGIPSGNLNQFGTHVLNIDCIENRRELIDRWASEISLIIQTNSDKYSTGNSVLLLLEHKTAGIVQKFIKNTNWDIPQPIHHPVDMFHSVLDAIYMMFLGIDNIANKLIEQAREAEKARVRLTNLTICDICYLDDFTCDYEICLYKIEDWNQYPELIKQYLLKIPIVGETAFNRFFNEATTATKFSLAYAKTLVVDEIQKVCNLSNTQKKLKRFNKNCCSLLTKEKPLEYGCKPNFTPKRKSSKKPLKKKKFSKKKNTSRYKPGKYFYKQKDKAKFCPKNKKNCRCWICSEEGHYANECPNKKEYPEKVKMIEIASNINLLPIEVKYDDKQVVYSLIEEPPDELDESSSSSTSSDSESDSD